MALALMRRKAFSEPLPWTHEPVYEWFRQTVAGMVVEGTTGTSSPLQAKPSHSDCRLAVRHLVSLLADARRRLSSCSHSRSAEHRNGRALACGYHDTTIAEMGPDSVQWDHYTWLANHSDESEDLRVHLTWRAWALRKVAFSQGCLGTILLSLANRAFSELADVYIAGYFPPAWWAPRHWRPSLQEIGTLGEHPSELTGEPLADSSWSDRGARVTWQVSAEWMERVQRVSRQQRRSDPGGTIPAVTAGPSCGIGSGPPARRAVASTFAVHAGARRAGQGRAAASAAKRAWRVVNPNPATASNRSCGVMSRLLDEPR
jgi:hypothetical protein